jgi:hypothetical protein
MVVSVVALFVALGGTGYAAAKLSNQSQARVAEAAKPKCNEKCQDTKLIKSLFPGASVAKAKLAKFATSAGKATFATSAGTATSATSATSATHATNADNATRATSAAAVDNIKSWYVTASVGQTVPLLTIGPFTYTGQCTLVSGNPHAQTMVQTSQDNSVVDSYGAAGHVPLNVADGAVPVGYASDGHNLQTTAGTHWVGPYDGSDSQLSGDGHTYVITEISVGTVFQGADCLFVGLAFVLTH